MANRIVTILLTLNLILFGGFLLRTTGSSGSAAAQSSTKSPNNDNKELQRLFEEDQSDREPPDGKSLDQAVMQARDLTRLSRVKELYAQNKLLTGADYYHAAMVLQHGDTPGDYLLAHEFCVVGISKGESRAKWLAAASEDRFLMMIGRPQRFGTQYLSVGADSAFQLYKVDSDVTDKLRGMLDVPPLQIPKIPGVGLDKKKSVKR